MIRENVSTIQRRIREICLARGRSPEELTLVAVAKGRTVAQIREAMSAGLTQIGENRVQEASLKYSQLSTTELPNPYLLSNGTPRSGDRLPTIKWHMVGHLQTNKIKDALKIFDLIQSVDSLRLAREIDAQAGALGKVQDILIEVNTSGEASKFGVRPQDTAALAEETSGFRNIRLKGLMTIAPIVEKPAHARPYFRKLKELFDEINGLRTTDYRLRTLSMGMTDDFEVAIEEGATMVRLGRAVFGE